MRGRLAQRRQRDTEKNELKPHLKKTWCIGSVNAAFLAQMERLLWLYSLPLNARFPVVCFDERPCFLIGETVAALALKAGSARREHYEYEKHGSCALLAAIEPQTGQRLAQVYDRRCKREYALFLKELAAQYPQAEKIRLVQDNLNTHNTSSLYETFAAQEAFALAQRFEFYYTPKKASWLNMIEIEFSAIARQCLQRRIASKAELEREVLSLVKERAAKAIKIEWQFSIQAARTKLNRHYEQVQADNVRYKAT
ncbi:MAG: IS630 family transposase [Acidobacteria bacterium]|nr:IS630 family transposase [Acidobacteriota bacterium]